MTKHIPTLLFACSIFFAIPATGHAALGDCGQPVTNGTTPTAADCLFILKAAVGTETCEPSCVCDTNNLAAITAADALLCLKKAVGQDILLTCPTPCGVVTTSTSTTSSSTSSSTSTVTVVTSTTVLLTSEAAEPEITNADTPLVEHAADEKPAAAPSTGTAPASADPEIASLLTPVGARTDAVSRLQPMCNLEL